MAGNEGGNGAHGTRAARGPSTSSFSHPAARGTREVIDRLYFRLHRAPRVLAGAGRAGLIWTVHPTGGPRRVACSGCGRAWRGRESARCGHPSGAKIGRMDPGRAAGFEPRPGRARQRGPGVTPSGELAILVFAFGRSRAAECRRKVVRAGVQYRPGTMPGRGILCINSGGSFLVRRQTRVKRGIIPVQTLCKCDRTN